jgi:hypothetical protein
MLLRKNFDRVAILSHAGRSIAELSYWTAIERAVVMDDCARRGLLGNTPLV